jgi:exopolysaccharide production protein ExoZ
MISAKLKDRQPTGPLPSIQILRAVAALAVLISHLSGSLAEFGYFPNPVPVFDFGAAGVDLFFVISGFIMVYTSERLFAEPGAPQRFFSRRLIRIFPLYWALTTITVAASGWHGLSLPEHLAWKNIIGSYLLFPMTGSNGGAFPVLVQAWTLYYEMFFYALFAFVIVFPKHFAVVILTVIFVVVVSVARLVGPNLEVPWSIWSAPIIYEFVFGMWIALAFRSGWRLHPAVCCIGAIAVLTLMVTAHQYGLIDERPLTSNYSRPLIWGTGAALIVATFALADVTRSLPTVLRPLVVLGDASYALYLVHEFVPLGLHAIHAPRIVDPASYPFSYSALTAAIAILSALLLNVLDQKFRNWLLEKAGLRPAFITSAASRSAVRS